MLKKIVSGIILLVSFPIFSQEIKNNNKAVIPKVSTVIVSKTGDLLISIVKVKPLKGSLIYLSIYSGKETWMNKDLIYKIEKIKAESETVEIRVKGLPHGNQYAFQIFHDENKNGILDFKKIPPMPDEGTAISNNHYRWGPPLFKKARFEIIGGKTTFQKIKMHY